eukprot:GAFH01004606.1.p1 GENE.GAFH01004606.1~~GAFH01004606.1.p1  ORF type:complete len:247 (+),score=36.65 GAFH01004606.1:22-741(+)
MRFLLVAALFFSVSLAAACQRSASDGTTWDLSSLVKPAGSSYRIQDSTYSYEFNICEDMTSTAVPRCQSALPAAVIQLYSYWCTKLGVTKQETVRPLKDASGQTTGVNVTYGGGDSCGELNRQVSFLITCGGQPTDQPTKIREYPVDSCMFEVVWTNPAGCPTSTGGGISFGTVMLIIMLVGATCFFAGGACYKRFRKGLTGLEMIPCWGAIKALPGLVWDGIKATFTLSLCRSGYSRI